MKPYYAENIVVAIKDNSIYEWYVLCKEIVFLDYIKWIEAYNSIGFNLPIEAPDRFNILVVNNDTKAEFLSNINSDKVSSDVLREMLIQETDSFDKLAYKPSVLIDFDNQNFINAYYEHESFEDFVPDGWTGSCKEFYNEVPQNKKYWLIETGESIIDGLI